MSTLHLRPSVIVYRTAARDLVRGFKIRTDEGRIVKIVKVFTLDTGHIFMRDDTGCGGTCHAPDTMFDVVSDN